LSVEEIRYHYNRGGPVAHWKMDEGSGQTVYDATPNNNDGTIPGSAEMATSTPHGWTTGKDGSALSFDGVDDYVDVDFTNGSANYSALTASVWIKKETSGLQILLNESSADTLWFRIDSNKKFSAYLGDTSNKGYHASNSTINNKEWVHLVLSYNDSTDEGKMYINGKLDKTFITSGTVNFDSALKIGSREDLDGSFFNGLIDDVRIYNYARTPSQILLDYNAGLSAHFR